MIIIIISIGREKKKRNREKEIIQIYLPSPFISSSLFAVDIETNPSQSRATQGCCCQCTAVFLTPFFFSPSIPHQNSHLSFSFLFLVFFFHRVRPSVRPRPKGNCSGNAHQSSRVKILPPHLGKSLLHCTSPS